MYSKVEVVVMIELKPCPFCGGEAEAYYVIDGSFACSCTSCNYASCTGFNTEQEAIAAWNTRAERIARIEDSDLPKTSPLPGIPSIRVYDKDGMKCAEGYYVFHQNRQLCVFNDKLKPEDCDHLIVADGFADWNMPTGIEVKKIVPDGGWVEMVS